jgi:hypothetical protein
VRTVSRLLWAQTQLAHEAPNGRMRRHPLLTIDFVSAVLWGARSCLQFASDGPGLAGGGILRCRRNEEPRDDPDDLCPGARLAEFFWTGLRRAGDQDQSRHDVPGAHADASVSQLGNQAARGARRASEPVNRAGYSGAGPELRWAKPLRNGRRTSRSCKGAKVSSRRCPRLRRDLVTKRTRRGRGAADHRLVNGRSDFAWTRSALRLRLSLQANQPRLASQMASGCRRA